ncbi:hypothetical protein ASF00_11400 [Sphingomonas sp. Leaf34]|uniref:hypothetical protein n=1 Tax=Sphingomonas sp. Leaf34 TaxID=1736216 RepID=UPI0007010AD3|nr:hypothetical protein [Sphingomonas sp. Leaf34]KQN28438.1 hypothetical protein ASF00_11400 [Sphingomonas sp. Leaf34]
MGAAGANSSATPETKWRATESYDNEQFSPTLEQRWLSHGGMSRQDVVCSAGACSVSASSKATIDYDRIKRARDFDVGGALNVAKRVRMFVAIANQFDHDPGASPDHRRKPIQGST